MLDRFKDAKWHIEHGTGVYGTLACGHPTIVADTAGHSCSRTGRQEDQEANARLIALAPTLLRIVKTLEGAWDSELKMPQCGIEAELEFEGAIDEAREAIAKVEGPDGGYARLLDTDPNFESFVRGYIDKAEGRA